MREWPGRPHVETLRLWPDLVQTVGRIELRADLFEGVMLLGSLSRGEGDAISDIDLAAVTRAELWQQAWDARAELSAGALVAFDRFGDRDLVAGHTWLAPSLVKVECLITAPGEDGMRLAGNVAVLSGPDDLPEQFERRRAFTRQEIDEYAAELRANDAIPEIERAYGDLITLLRREVRTSGANP
jgi:predicted nucleotidyltransferase